MYYVSPPKSCDVAFNQWGREGGEMMGDGGGAGQGRFSRAQRQNHPSTRIELQWQSASVWQQLAEDAEVIAGTHAHLHAGEV